jgi:hypothetical protein
MNARLAALLTTGAAIAAATAAIAATPTPATAAAGRTSVARSAALVPVNDYWEQTHHNIQIGASGGVRTLIMSRELPAGNWVLHADQTIVNFGPSDYASCSIADTSNINLNTHRTLVGNPGVAGARGPASYVTQLSETAAVSLSRPTTAMVTCSHDVSNGATPYIDANADLWAHRSARLVVTQLP